MYEAHFGFREPPFRITPDPRFLYRNPCVEEAAAALAYGIERRKGFITLVGEAGTGKTTLLRHVLDSLAGNVRTVVLLHPTVEFDEILEYILSELGVPTEGGRKLVLLQRLHEFLLEHTRGGGNVALLVDEAQDLEARVLEELRLLSNLETGTEKILQIVLAGQPELETKLADQSLRQLRQRIALHIRLRPLSAEEVRAYIRTRLELAGATRTDIFTPDAVARIAEVSTGIPRIVNVLCDACLVTSYAVNARQVTAEIVDESWADYGRLVGELPPLPAPEPRVARGPAAPREPVALREPTPVELTDVLPAPAAPAVQKPVEAPAAEPAAPAPEPPAPAATRSPRPPLAPPAEPALGADTEPTAARAGDDLRSPWWAGARPATAGAVVAIVAMLALNYSLRSPAPNRDARPLPETAVADMPVVAADDDPMVGAPSSTEARALVHRFLVAYESRDAAAIAALFAADGVDNEDRGPDAIRAAYERTFAEVRDLTVAVPHVDSQVHGTRLTVTGPMVVAYRDPDGAQMELRGTAQWEIARLDGAARIVRLRHDVSPHAS